MKSLKRRLLSRVTGSKRFKKAAVITAGALLVAGAAAGTVFLVNENRHKQMAEQVRLMEAERQRAAVASAEVSYAGAVRQSQEFTVNLFGMVGGALGAFIAAFFGRLLAVGAVKTPLAAAAVGILPFAFVLFTLFALLYRVVYGSGRSREFYSFKNIAVLGGASVICAAAFELCDRLCGSRIVAALLQTVMLLVVIAAAWFIIFADFKSDRTFRDRRAIIMLAAALAGGGLFGGAMILLVNAGQTAPAARSAVFAVWLLLEAAAVVIYIAKRKKRGGLSQTEQRYKLSV